MILRLTFTILLLFSCLGINIFSEFTSQAHGSLPANSTGPIVLDQNLKVELVSRGLKSPTSMAFLGPNDILVLEKKEGTVRRVINGTLLPEPLLKVPVSSEGERGMLGIDITDQENKNATYVFLYFTTEGLDGQQPPSNRLYRYELVGDKLTKPKLLIEIPADKGRLHNGGVVLVGPDDNVYLVVGDLKGPDPQRNELINGRSGILRFSLDGGSVGEEILGEGNPLNLYFAYGIQRTGQPSEMRSTWSDLGLTVVGSRSREWHHSRLALLA